MKDDILLGEPAKSNRFLCKSFSLCFTENTYKQIYIHNTRLLFFVQLIFLSEWVMNDFQSPLIDQINVHITLCIFVESSNHKLDEKYNIFI